ncbi:archaellin/type IV pilin N-terminal domain-containing protein [Halobium palmae]|uniref:Flagellin n=1 Tax=Halobium palmae TaxID=1776492 RepID=A0ABD5RVQ9_9EURY
MNWNPLSSLFSDGDRDRGQVGIGTLIVFIAMVLVAAIAAGVLINTAGFLQQSAEQTGQESTNAVTQKLEATTVTGNVENNKLSEIKMVVKKSAGADTINLKDASIQYISEDADETLEAGEFKVYTTDDDTVQTASDPTSAFFLSGAEDRLIIKINTGTGETVEDQLSGGETATLKITTASGATTHIEIQVPEPATDGYTEL